MAQIVIVKCNAIEPSHNYLKLYINCDGDMDYDSKSQGGVINNWRQNKWKNFEGKPIKNHEQIGKLDKLRKKVATLTYAK